MNDTTTPLLDVLASLARTALDDPNALPEAPRPWTGKTEDPTLYAGEGYEVYAIDRLDEIINALNPAEETTEAYADTLTMLGRQLAERADKIEQDELTYEEHDDAMRKAYEEAHTALSQALDLLDEAIAALRPEEA